MAYEQRDMSGSMFENDRKTEDRHPDFKGSCMVAGVEYWVSAWDKVGASGKPYTSLAFTKKEPKPDAQPEPQRAPAASVDKPGATSKGAKAIMDMEDDIPF